MVSTIEGQGFRVLPRELAPIYARIRSNSNVLTLFERIHSFERKTEPTTGDWIQVEHDLNELARTIYFHTFIYTSAMGKIASLSQNAFKSFNSDFGHLPPELNENISFSANCVSNALAQTILLDEFGGKTGVLSLPNHVVPTLKLRGRTYAFDVNLLELPAALTVAGYIKYLKMARKNPKSKFNKFSLALFPKKGISAGAFNYQGGADASLSSVYSNFGLFFLQKSFQGSSSSPKIAKKAEENFRMALRLNPNNISAASLLGKLLLVQGRYAESRKAFLVALRLRPDICSNRFFVGLAEYHLGNFKTASEHFSQVHKFNPKHEDTLAHLALSNFELGNFEAAFENMARLVNLNPQHPLFKKMLDSGDLPR